MKIKLIAHGLCAALVAMLISVSVPQTAQAFDLDSFKVSGYIREYVSFNLQNIRETAEDDKFDLSMARTQVRFDLEAELQNIRFVTVIRADREIETNYLERLDELRRANAAAGATGVLIGGGLAPAAAAPIGAAVGAGIPSLTDILDTTDFREWYADFDVTDRVWMRVGKQQVAFGEADQFQATDLLHGFDDAWRSLLEGDNEERRKPRVMINTQIQVPEFDGALQLLFFPGLDSKRDIGTIPDLYGGRWAAQGTRGLDSISHPYGFPINFEHAKGDYQDQQWAARWSGALGPVNYSMQYMSILSPTPVFNPNAPIINGIIATTGLAAVTTASQQYLMPNTAVPGLFGLNAGVPGAAIAGAAGELIFPEIDVVGFTANYYEEFTDAVWSTEIAWTKDKPFNFGRYGAYGLTPATPTGAAGIIRKDHLAIMLRADKQLYLQDYIGTNRSSLLSVQLVDLWVPDFKTSEELVVGPGLDSLKEHSAVISVLLGMSYANDTINPSLIAIQDLSYGGTVIAPQVNFVYGDAWRLRLEVDVFIPDNDAKPGELFAFKPEASPIGTAFARNSQFLMVLTRQF